MRIESIAVRINSSGFISTMRKQTKKKERDVQTTELRDDDEIFIVIYFFYLFTCPWYIGSTELSHATAKLMSLFRGWRKKLSSTIDRFSVNLSARPYNRHKPTPECVLEIRDKTCKEQLYQPLAVHLCSYSSGFLNIADCWNFCFKKFE